MLVEAATKTLGADLSLVGRPGLQNKALMSSIFEHFHGEFGCFHTLSLNAPQGGKHSCFLAPPSAIQRETSQTPAENKKTDIDQSIKTKRLSILWGKKHVSMACNNFMHWCFSPYGLARLSRRTLHSDAIDTLQAISVLHLCERIVLSLWKSGYTSSKWHWITSLTFVHELIR